MYKFPIGVIVDSFRLPIPEAVKKAAEIGAQGIQVYASRGEMAPENLTSSLIAEKKRIIDGCGLVVSALCGDIGGYDDPKANEEKVERFKRILLAGERRELGALIKTLYRHRELQRSKGKKLHISDERYLKSAERALFTEFAVVLGKEFSEIAQTVAAKLAQQFVTKIPGYRPGISFCVFSRGRPRGRAFPPRLRAGPCAPSPRRRPRRARGPCPGRARRGSRG